MRSRAPVRALVGLATLAALSACPRRAGFDTTFAALADGRGSAADGRLPGDRGSGDNNPGDTVNGDLNRGDITNGDVNSGDTRGGDTVVSPLFLPPYDLTYRRSWLPFVASEQPEDITPVYLGGRGGVTFSAPFGLPPLMSIDATTGQILGAFNSEGSEVGYTLRVENPAGFSDVSVSFYAFFDEKVNSTLDAPDAAPGDGSCDDGAGNCTLRAAVMEAAALGTKRAVSVPSGYYLLTGGPLLINTPAEILIQGKGFENVYITSALAGQCLQVQASPRVTIEGVTMAGCGGGVSGGAIDTDAVLLRVLRTNLSDNTASVGMGGGAIYVRPGREVDIEHSVLSRNSATQGGAISADSDARIDLRFSHLSFNTATSTDGGAIGIIGTMGEHHLSDNNFVGNQAVWGGAIYARGMTTLSRNLLQRNLAQSGGGAVYHESGNFNGQSNSFYFNRTAMGVGSAMVLAGTSSLRFNTFAGNSVSLEVVRVEATGVLDLEANAFGPKTGGTNCTALGAITSTGYNAYLTGDDCGPGVSTDFTTPDLGLDVAPRFAGIGMLTLGTLPASPLVDAVDAMDCPLDGASRRRPIDGNGLPPAQCDTGAFERWGVVEPPRNLSYDRRFATLMLGLDVGTQMPTLSGGAPESFVVHPRLPDGLTLHPGTGAITGVPTELQPQAVVHVVHASNQAGATVWLMSLRVLDGYDVTNGGDVPDDGPGDGICRAGMLGCTLRAAAMEAAAQLEPRYIRLGSGTYDVSGTPLPVVNDLAIIGNGISNITVMAVHAFDPLPARTISLSDVVITGARSSSVGSVLNSSSAVHLQLSHCLMVDNASAGSGGAINLDGAGHRLDIDACVFSNNRVTTAGMGGAIASTNGFVTITRSQFNSNTSEENGGAIGLDSPGAIDRSLFETNVAGQSVVGGSGGAIYTSSDGLTISNSTFFMNQTLDNAGGALAVVVPGNVALDNSTLVDNDATTSGGALRVFTTSLLSLRNSLFSGNTTAMVPDTCDSSGSLQSDGGNLFDAADPQCPMVAGDTIGAPQLATTLPAPIGGRTDGFALMPGSPAINGGVNLFCSAVDQRGVQRPADNGSGTYRCDSGAYEAP